MKVPLDNFNACDDFFVLVVKSHILTAAMQMLGMAEVSDIPSSPLFPNLENEWMESAEHRKNILQQISVSVVKKFADFHFNTQLLMRLQLQMVFFFMGKVFLL